MNQLFILFALVLSQALIAAPKGKVLVILSSEDKITLKDGKTHPTGFFLSELMGPTKELTKAGYELTFANPKGTKAVIDAVSDKASWFGQGKTAEKQYRELRARCEKLQVCGKAGEIVGTKNLAKLSDVIAGGLDSFKGVFLPGGHAPMEDLWKDQDLKTVLKHFHEKKKPTALICHAPIALLAALDNPESYIDALTKDDRDGIQEATKGWIYAGYEISVFTSREEQQEEPGQDNALGGFVKFYPDAALERAGAYVVRADKWKNGVSQSKELITGQNPFSHGEFAKRLVRALDK